MKTRLADLQFDEGKKTRRLLGRHSVAAKRRMNQAEMIDIPKTYDPKEAEAEHYSRWEGRGCFAPEINNDPDAPVFSIVIPPPNVTGSLHMGHALQHTIMDVLARH